MKLPRLKLQSFRLAAAASLSAALMLCLAGCSDILGAVSTSAGTTAAPASHAEASTPEPSPSPTPFSINPLYSFYYEYLGDIAADYNGLHAALESEGSLESFDISFALSSHAFALSELASTVCRLFEGENGGWSDAISGAASGTGSMYELEESRYSFTFQYADGIRFIDGEYLADESVSFRICEYDSAAPTPAPESDDETEATPVATPEPEREYGVLSECSIKRTPGGWRSSVKGDGWGELVWSEGYGIRFSSDAGAVRLYSTLEIISSKVKEAQE